MIKPSVPANTHAAWRMKLSVAHRGPRPGKTTVAKPPKNPTWKTRF